MKSARGWPRSSNAVIHTDSEGGCFGGAWCNSVVGWIKCQTLDRCCCYSCGAGKCIGSGRRFDKTAEVGELSFGSVIQGDDDRERLGRIIDIADRDAGEWIHCCNIGNGLSGNGAADGRGVVD